MTYSLTVEDFKQAFEFGINYYLDPNKNTTGRTTGEPRGLGAIIDAFTLGKLTEIGVVNILKEKNPNKDYKLDFDIKSNTDVKDEPDIVKIKEGDTEREPNVFIEIKNTLDNGRWIGLTEEQYNTIKDSAKGRKIYMIYASIKSNILNSNPKTTDLAGMFLKSISSKDNKIFDNFADLNAELKIEFIISQQEFEAFSYPFKEGMNMYETNLFEEKTRITVYKKDGKLVSGVKRPKKYTYEVPTDIEILIKKNLKAENSDISTFSIMGTFKLFSKGAKTIIECITDVTIQNNIFGVFNLDKNKFYSFNLVTIGQNPKLKRNNLFIAKNRVYQLIDDGNISTPIDSIDIIAKEI